MCVGGGGEASLSVLHVLSTLQSIEALKKVRDLNRMQLSVCVCV